MKMIDEIEALKGDDYLVRDEQSFDFAITKAIEIIRKHEQPVSGGVDANDTNVANIQQVVEFKQTHTVSIPADEMLREWRPISLAEKETGVEILGIKILDDRIVKEPFVTFWSPTLNKFYCEPTHYIDMPLAPEITTLSQPSKPAMTRAELENIIRKIVNTRKQGQECIPDIITALEQAGVLTIKKDK